MLLEMGQDEFASSGSVDSLQNILEELEFGEIVITVVHGKVETMRITHTYKPIDKT